MIRVLTFVAIVTGSQASALSGERVQQLYDLLGQTLSCDVASGLLTVTLAEDRESFREIMTSAASELGTAMIAGQVSDPDPGYGRRCLVNFNLPRRQDLNSADAQFLIGFEIGKVRSCMNELFYRELLEAVPPSPKLGGNSDEENDIKARAQEFALVRFESLGCNDLASPE